MVRPEFQVSPELVAFYRSRLDSFERERAASVALVEAASVERGRVYSLEQAASRSGAQVTQLQKALSDAQLQLFEVRDKVLQLEAARDGLLLEGKQDKARIQSLLAFTQPVLHDLHYAKDTQPASVATQPLIGRRDVGAPARQPPQETLRTVFLPNEEVQLLLAKLGALQAQLAQQHAFSQERIAALLDNRKQREEISAAQAAEAATKLQDLEAQLDQRSALLERTTRELLLSRHQQAAAERACQERTAGHATAAERAQGESQRVQRQLDLALELLPRQCADAVRALGTALANANVAAGTDTNAEDTEARCREAAMAAAEEHRSGAERRAREQAASLERELKQERSATQTVGRQQQQRIRHLEDQLRSLKARQRELQYRRALDIQGFAAEMGLIRKQLMSIERRVREVALAAESATTDPLTIVEQLAAVRDQLDTLAAKMLDQEDRTDR